VSGLQLFSRQQLPMIHQVSIAECGLSCIAMISSYFGYQIDIQTLRSRFATSLRGMNFVDIQNVSEKMGLATRAVRVKPSSLQHLQCPAILHWNKNHFVVLKKVGRKNIVIHDPEMGVVTIPNEEIGDFFHGVAMEFYPSQNFVKGVDKKKASVWDLFRGIPGIWNVLGKAFLISFAIEFFANLIPLYTQWILDDVLVTGDLDFLTLLFVAYLGVVACQSTISLLRTWMLMRFGISLNAKLQIRVFTHLLKLPQKFFEERSIGDILSRYNALHSIQETLTSSFVETLINGIMAIFVGIIIFVYSPYLASIAVLFVLAYALLRWLRYMPLKRATEEQIVAGANVETHFLETLRGVRSIRLFNKEVVRRNQWMRLMFESFNRAVRVAYLNINYGEVGNVLSSIERGLLLFLGAKEVLSGNMTIGFLLAFIVFKDQFVWRIDMLIQRIIDFGMIKIQIDRLADITQSKPLDEPELPYLAIGEMKTDILFKDVAFRYSSHESWVVQNLSFHAKEGEHLVIVGRSGSGKTTVAKLLLRLLEPEEGEIFVGGVSLHQLGSSSTQLISCVMQDDSLYAGTLLENITFFDSEPDMEWVERCARVAEIHMDILQMKMGYNTIVGDLGSSLSGGQQQRLLIARALYAKPKILVMDEATSDLDVELESKIANNIRELKITRISIAHRPQTIASADRAIELTPQAQ
jgi:ATP-binding cassette subfamily B protein RaxB